MHTSIPSQYKIPLTCCLLVSVYALRLCCFLLSHPFNKTKLLVSLGLLKQIIPLHTILIWSSDQSDHTVSHLFQLHSKYYHGFILRKVLKSIPPPKFWPQYQGFWGSVWPQLDHNCGCIYSLYQGWSWNHYCDCNLKSWFNGFTLSWPCAPLEAFYSGLKFLKL